ncbi:aquaporin-like protein [Stylonychia lemnae]|uniref:Aquaporin-like protein n=1 Tax=Stylonychia lemnae TaxID=5949 RepID=A0A078B9Y5_STYLE|nr:aquaporin-like protein [Stylonychia lemnae]|eukprot:CDW91031.1 aquaporin-like protein [Stylonychia lemnae]
MEAGILQLISRKSFIFLALYEFLGTFIALLSVNCAQNNSAVVGVGFFIAATLTGRVSGGHFNGAVTIAVYIIEGRWCKNLFVAFFVIVVDILAAFTAMAVALAMLGVNGTFTLLPPQTKQLVDFGDIITVLFEETLFTWILVTSILFVKYRNVTATSDGMLSNLTVGLAIYVTVSMSGPITGGALNPTFGLALISTDIIAKGYYPEKTAPVIPEFLISYTIGPILGGILAGLMLILTQKIAPLLEEEVPAYEEDIDQYDDEEELIAHIATEPAHKTSRPVSINSADQRNYTVQQTQPKNSQKKKRIQGVTSLQAKDYLFTH